MTKYNDIIRAIEAEAALGIKLDETNVRTLAELGRKMKKKKEPRGKWYNINALMGYEWAHFLYIGGTGGVGKSYQSLHWILRRKYRNPEKVHIYIARMSDVQCKKLLCDNAKTLIDPDLYRKFGKELRTRGEIVYYGHTEGNPTNKGRENIKFIREGELCRVINLSTCFNTKGNGIYDNAMPHTDEIYILFDEAVRDKDGGEMNRFSIVENFTNQLETLLRSFKGKWKVIFCANAVGSPEILAHWNFIPRKPGIYKIKKAETVIQILAESEDFHEEERVKSASYKFNSSSNRFASTVNSEGAVIATKQQVRERRPSMILAFGKNKEKWYTLSGNIVTKYNKESKKVFAMRRYIDEFYDIDVVRTIIELFEKRALLFDNCSTYLMFSDELERLKK